MIGKGHKKSLDLFPMVEIKFLVSRWVSFTMVNTIIKIHQRMK